MKFLHTDDKQIYEMLVKSGCKLLNIRKSANQSEVFTFQLDENIPLCFNILSDASMRQKCIVTDKLTMTF